jgi:hypothetical protein
MNKQFAELQVYQLGGGIAFGLPGTTTPFLALPSGQATIKPWGTSGFLFENILTGDVIAFVAEYDDILDSSDAPYGVDQPAVFTALAAFFFDVAGGGSSDLATVLGIGNTSGSNDIFFDSSYGLEFANASRFREGTIDAGLGGSKGIAQICAVGYELKWEAGRLYVMDGNGVFIRHSLYNFNVIPTAADDDTKGYYAGSRWSLDDGSVYVCSDSTTGAAVWTLESVTIPIDIQVACSDETTALTAGTAKVTFRVPCAITLTSVRASLTTAQASGSIFTVDINENGTSILSTKLTIDNTEKTSTTAATPAVISDTALADDAEITIDIDQIGDGTAKGLKITLIGTRA